MATVHKILEKKGRNKHVISSTSTVYEALKQMVEKNVGAIIVEDDGIFKGVFTERDYARKVMLQGRSSRDTLVKEILNTDHVTVTTNTHIEECMNLMTSHFVRYLPVFENEVLIGIISIGDVVKYIIEDQQFALHQLESYIADSRY